MQRERIMFLSDIWRKVEAAPGKNNKIVLSRNRKTPVNTSPIWCLCLGLKIKPFAELVWVSALLQESRQYQKAMAKGRTMVWQGRLLQLPVARIKIQLRSMSYLIRNTPTAPTHHIPSCHTNFISLTFRTFRTFHHTLLLWNSITSRNQKEKKRERERKKPRINRAHQHIAWSSCSL